MPELVGTECNQTAPSGGTWTSFPGKKTCVCRLAFTEEGEASSEPLIWHRFVESGLGKAAAKVQL